MEIKEKIHGILNRINSRASETMDRNNLLHKYRRKFPQSDRSVIKYVLIASSNNQKNVPDAPTS